MSTPVSILGDCVSCRQRDVYLFRWKPTLDGEKWQVWICQPCRDLPQEELAERIEHSLTLPILPGERLILKTPMPTAEDLAECLAVAEAAREVLDLLDRQEVESND
jgi:hypothetical protein